MGRASGKTAEEQAERKRKYDLGRAAKISASGQEIGPLPEVKNPLLRERGFNDPVFFLGHYFPNRFYLGFGRPHLEAIRVVDECMVLGGLFALAMMRGSGKTSIVEAMAIRALVYGLRRYLVLLGATDGLASNGVKRVLRELESNPRLLDDFPEVCYPIHMLGRITQRARGQKLNGRPTNIELTDGHLVLPTVEGAASSGSVVQAFGLTGALKGLQRLSPDGTPIRPDMVLMDDCQTRESAASPTQTETRERIISDDVLGLAGPKTKMAAVFLCTPIYPNDLTERFISRDRHPEWKGTRTRMVESFPNNEEMWDQYSEVRRESLRSGDEGKRSNEFYIENRAAMDEGCVLAWPDRVKDGDVSSIQTAMNLRIDNPIGFASEYQCEPEQKRLTTGAKELVPAAISVRLSGVPQFEAPTDCSRVTAFVDVGGELLWYALVGWNENFGGSVLDYGAWPQQTRSVFAAADPRPGLSNVFPGYTESQRVYAGLSALLPMILGRIYHRTGGGQELQVERCLVDAGWQSDAVYQAVTASPHSATLFPSKGVGRSTTQVGVAKWKTRPGERSGWHWRLSLGETGRGRQIQFDPDAWKTFLYNALVVPLGGKTALTLFGKSAGTHEMVSEHLAAEYSEPVTIRGDTFDKWQVKAGRQDNHLLDCVVGAAVAASVQGLQIPSTNQPVGPPVPPKLVSISELYAKANAGRPPQ